MGYKLAIDFGTTNTVVAHWNEQNHAPEVVALSELSQSVSDANLPLIPSLVYVQNGVTGEVTIGDKVRLLELDRQRDNRLFRNFKRGIVTSPSPEPRQIDGAMWGDREVGQSFMRRLLDALPQSKSEIDQLVLTAPVASFEGYLAWLNGLITDVPEEKIRVVDESTAAALGYAVTESAAAVLVFDFGGGTLDLSLVQLPESREKTGGFLRRLLGGNANQHSAKVIAKTGRVIGGSDIDQWLVAEVLQRTGVTTQALGSNYSALLTACEQAKIALSTALTAEIRFEAEGTPFALTLERAELEQILEKNGFHSAIRHIVDKVMHISHRRGIFKEDIKYVLLVGGTSLMPCVQDVLRGYFSGMAVRADKPFTAVAEGALQVAAGYGLEDHLIHSYALRY
ncbi:MAG: Hsp70 family protein [Anaerolineae bacterium]